MTFPILYSRTSVGNIQTWQIFHNNNSYWTIEGILDGKLTKSEPTFVKGKNLGRANETTEEDQAIKESEAKFKKKIKSGYHKDINNVDNFVFVEPMLAKKFEDRKNKINYPVATQNKLNGGRCVATKDGLFTRKGEKYVSVPHIENSLKDFFIKWPDAVLDGELFGQGFKQTLNETMKLIRRTVHITAEDLINSERLVKYHIYDGYNFDNMVQSDCYLVRAAAIKKNLADNPYYAEVETVICNNEEEVYSHFNKLIEDNEEGAIVRLLNYPYENKRSAGLLKMKSEDDDEAVIVDISEGLGYWAGTGKRISLKWRDIEFDSTFKGTHEQAVQFLKDKDSWIGKTVTFLYNGFTGKMVPNYARVDINNCLKS